MKLLYLQKVALARHNQMNHITQLDIMSKILSYKKRLLNQFGSLSHKTFLDYGCGSGDFIKLTLAQNPERIVGVDSSEKMIGSIKNSSVSMRSPKKYAAATI